MNKMTTIISKCLDTISSRITTCILFMLVALSSLHVLCHLKVVVNLYGEVKISQCHNGTYTILTCKQHVDIKCVFLKLHKITNKGNSCIIDDVHCLKRLFCIKNYSAQQHRCNVLIKLPYFKLPYFINTLKAPGSQYQTSQLKFAPAINQVHN